VPTDRVRPPALELRRVNVTFGPVQALRGVDFFVRPGEVVALVGDNGAGKSTLVKIMSGICPVDSGSILVDGEERHVGSPRDAAAAGIATVYQDLALCNDLDIVANLFLGQEMRSDTSRALSEEEMELHARQLLASLHITTITNIRAKVARLSGGQRQSIAVARALVHKATVVLLDEPTAALGVAQAAEVLALVRRLKEQGVGVVIISHNLHDVLAISDRIHVLRLGRTNGVFTNDDLDTETIVAAITGAHLESDDPVEATP
jgi:D-xylose transport system ATP-binding protein